MARKSVRFKNSNGQQLAAILDLPSGPPRAYALFAHCFTCSKNLKAVAHVARPLNEAGIAVLRFDFTGLGGSEGDFSDTNFSSNVDDILAAARYLAEAYEAPALLVGHSLGGTAVLQAAPALASVTAVATIGSPAQPSHVAHMFSAHADVLATRGHAEVSLGGRTFCVRKQFLDDLEKHDLPNTIGGLRKALLVMHAPLDGTVEIDNASELFVAARHPKSFVSLDQADHLLSREADSRYAGEVIAAWAARYLPETQPSAELATPPNRATVARTEHSGFRTPLISAGHALLADEPESFGGTDQGPSPYDLLSSALAACTTMTLRMYAERKGWPLEASTVTVEHQKVHASDCEDCETGSGKVDEFSRTVRLEGALDAEQRQRLLEIADRCPVHRTLHSEVKVRTALDD